jgi:hypothetical protein
LKDQHVKKALFVSLALAGAFVLSIAHAATITGNFSNNPLSDGWQIFGDTNLFQWDSTNHQLAVTWDSSQTNSYFYHPLGTILAKDDDFSLSFDLQLNNATAYGYGFELAISLLNFADATSTNLQRGVGIDPAFGARSVAEFDYFPDAGFGATISPTMISSNNQFASAFDFPLELTNGVSFHIVMTYTASNQTFSTLITNNNNGQPFGPIDDVPINSYGTSFSDFRLDTVAISSYSDTNSYGSILAHGIVDNMVVILPPPPVQDLTEAFSNGIWQVQFVSRSNWLYAIERTTDFQSWTNISTAIVGNATNLFLQDTNPPADKAFYRVSAERP